MPPLTGTTSQDPRKRDLDGSSTPNDAANSSTLGAGASPDAFSANEAASGVFTQAVLGNENGTKVDETVVHNQGIARPASPLCNDESQEERGAFDDSHLQVDQPKKKKKKKSKRPKSKRGLVIHCSLQLEHANLHLTGCAHWFRAV
jgi:hypothetical protein